MWKRFGAICGSFFFVIIIFGGVGAAWAACGGEPAETPGGWTWPIQGTLTNSWGYDCRADRGHRGIDISSSSGTTIRAAASGTVAFVGYTPAEGGGITVTIDHPGGLRSTYLHFSETSVSKGQSVNGGDPIGASDGGVLHFGIKLPGSGHDLYYDPLGFLPPLPVAGEPAPADVQTVTITDAPATEIALITSPEPGMEPVPETGTAVLPDQPLETLPSTATQPAEAASTVSTVAVATSPLPIETTSSYLGAVQTPALPLSNASSRQAIATAPADLLSTASSRQTESTATTQAPVTVQEPEAGESSNQPASPDIGPWPLMASATLDRVMAPEDKIAPSWQTIRAMYMKNPVNRLAVAAALLLVSLIASASVVRLGTVKAQLII